MLFVKKDQFESKDTIVVMDNTLSKSKTVKLNRFFNKVFGTNEGIGKEINKEFNLGLKNTDLLNLLHRRLDNAIKNNEFNSNDLMNFLSEALLNYEFTDKDFSYQFILRKDPSRMLSFNGKQCNTVEIIHKNKETGYSIDKDDINAIIYNVIIKDIYLLSKSKSLFLDYFAEDFGKAFENDFPKKLEETFFDWKTYRTSDFE